jgi:hypothetical protein
VSHVVPVSTYAPDCKGTAKWIASCAQNELRRERGHRCRQSSSVDLIQEQIRVAAGEKLSVTQDHVEVHGHAIECRVNAEDPDRDFAPAAGKLDVYVPPGGPWTRVDSHCYPAGPSSLTTTR